MSALALVGNYVLVIIPNVELASGVLFVTAFLFGIQMAVWCVLLVSMIFAFFNPWGPFIPPIWFAQVIGWIFIAVTGVIMGRQKERSWSRKRIAELAMVGAFLTLFFDLTTTLAYSWFFGVPFVLAIIAGLPFTMVHVVSNSVIFPAIVPRLDMSMRKQLESLFGSIGSLS